ncbi:MAG: Do family serine endopeptidase [Spirochaetaceae bacterium]|jgi:Do/DeqQ family serine protease|nr:Do family serine endopeptidase [Spirochaetaceae bacterium]
MNIFNKLKSGNFLIFNLVLIGIIFGAGISFLSFSCTSNQNKAQAQSISGTQAAFSGDALSVAESLQTAFRQVADTVLPSIVEVQTVSVSTQQNQFNGIPWEFFFGPQFGNPGQGDKNAPPRERRSQGLGSGIIVQKKGNVYYVLTNNHVVDGVQEITLITHNQNDYKAELVGKDDRKDLALLKFETSDSYPPALLGNSDNVKVGDIAIAIGNPLGYMFSVTQGIISAVGRSGGPAGNINDFIQTDASINQGNSGGALVNLKGEVIGINTWIASNSGAAGSIGLGFAIPINNATKTIDDLINKGSIQSGWLGVSLTDPDRDSMKEMGLEGKKGAMAINVFRDSPAWTGGIRPGDFITKLDGREMSGMNQLTLAVGDLSAGTTYTFTIIRDGTEQDIKVKIEKRNDDVANDGSKLWPGVYTVGLSESNKSQLNIDSKITSGVGVASIQQNSPAAVVRLEVGDVITEVSGTSVKNLKDFYNALREVAESTTSRSPKDLYFEVQREGNELETAHFRMK